MRPKLEKEPGPLCGHCKSESPTVKRHILRPDSIRFQTYYCRDCGHWLYKGQWVRPSDSVSPYMQGDFTEIKEN